MRTIAQSTAIPPDQQLAVLKEAKGGSWYDGWRPYCGQEQVKCTSPRMIREAYGFRCPCCGNLIGWDLQRLAESPLNPKPTTPNHEPPTNN